MKRRLIRILLAVSFIFFGARLQSAWGSLPCHPNAAFKKADVPNTHKDLDRIKAVEIDEDDETECTRHFTSCTPDFAAIYTSIDPSFPHHFQQNNLPFCEHLSYASEEKYILHLVIRI
jgi:hypothetical protein